MYVELLGGPNGGMRLRTGPNTLSWAYNLKTHTDNTYGGRVIQILAVNVTSLSVQIDAGHRGKQYVRDTLLRMRDLALWQRDTHDAVTFLYAPRRISARVYFQSITVQDKVDNVAFPYTVDFVVQEDLSGILEANPIFQSL